MKRKPEKNYKLPKYAAGLAAMLAAGTLTGCTDPVSEVQLDGDMVVPEDTEIVQLAGDVAYVEETAEETMAETTEEAIEETALAGDIAILPEEETVEVTLAGDAVLAPEDTCVPDIEPVAPGWVYVETETDAPQTAPASSQELMIAGNISVN